MDNSTKKIMTVAFVVTAFVAALVVDVLLDSLAATIGAVARFRSMDIVAHGLPVAVGLITFACLQFNSKVVLWADEVVVEIRKVVWPSRRDTSAMTIVTCVMLLISGTLLGVFDFVSRNLIKMFIN
ncbi:MAG: preprotein translocase subunit SecE [Bdellovibrionales bacterium]|nr:preprotein translocase subunit SecE [Bdellovibrionales bacterium]MCB9084683.1 preprotein translocase subunit SecE [Pseudobdellovibrionaceae bacterium]